MAMATCASVNAAAGCRENAARFAARTGDIGFARGARLTRRGMPPAAGAAARERLAVARRNRRATGSVGTKSALNEVAQLAELSESAITEIFRVSGVVFGITLVGLAMGFVLLRAEAIVEGQED